jgi:uncharacterized protein
MYPTQAVERPFGISVFGSSIMHTEPDAASLKFAVSRLEQNPKDSFRKAREAAKGIRAYLAQVGFTEVGSSRIALSQEFRFTGGEQRFVGYVARVSFHLLLRDLDQMEEVLSGVIDAGANEISAVEFQTSRLKEIRQEVRRQAVAAAREKAENYCQAANVTLGPVIHIEDINPDILESVRASHLSRETQQPIQPDDEGPLRAFNPGSITVGAAVVVAFELGRT